MMIACMVCNNNRHQLAIQVCIVESCCPLSRLGSIGARPSYHSRTQLWPVGYQASWQDAAVGTFHCDILDGDEEGPLFAVSLVPPQADQAAQV